MFDVVKLTDLLAVSAPGDLHLPQFNYTEPFVPTAAGESLAMDASLSQGFAFSALFQSSLVSSTSLGMSLLQRSVSEASSSEHASFIGFSWGPAADAFNLVDSETRREECAGNYAKPISMRSLQASQSIPTHFGGKAQNTPIPNSHRFSTPIRYPTATPYTNSAQTGTIRRSAPRRTVSDREAMKQLVDCVGMSARKKVLESGRKPRVLTSFTRNGSSSRKELRFVSSPIPLPDYNAPSPVNDLSRRQKSTSLGGVDISIPNGDHNGSLSVTEDTESEGPPSPSPRPGSAMSRRSTTPTLTSVASQRLGLASLSLNGGNFAAQNSGFRMDVNVPSDQGLNAAQNDHHAEALSANRQTATTASYTPSEFDGLEERHAVLMRDIGELEERLSNLTSLMKRPV